MKRFSKKRQAIEKLLKSTVEHPSAEWIYNRLKPEFPDLSLGTVYRNINELEKSGKIKSVGVVQDKMRYDADTKPHIHAICSKCGKIIDVKTINASHIKKAVSNEMDFTVSYANVQLVGLCNDCKNAE